MSRPSELPHQRKTNERWLAMDSISRLRISSQFQKLLPEALLEPLKYS
jgi:hypothetical protein